MPAPKRGLPPRRRMRHDRHFVDELTQRMGEGIGRMIPVTSITSNHDQPRSALGDLADLVESIRRHGILEPLLVRRKPGGEDSRHGYELVSGERRFHAALEAGLEEVPCIELEVTDQHALEIALIENLQRKDLDPFEEADGFQTLIEKYGYTHAQVAEAVGRSRVTITEALRLLEIPDDIRSRCRHADITAKGILLQIARAGDRATMERLVEAIASGELDREGLRELRRQEKEEAARSAATEGSDQPSESGRRRNKPFVMRFRHPEEPVTISVSFKTESEPEPERLIAVLEQLLEDLRARQRAGGSAESSEGAGNPGI